MIRFFKVCLVVAFSMFQRIWGYETGAPGKACQSMLPGHMAMGSGQRIQQQRGQAPFRITVNQTEYAPHEPIMIRIEGQQSFQGFMLQGRSNNMVVGAFSRTPVGTKVLHCTNMRDSLTHDSSYPKPIVDDVIWFPPEQESGPIRMVATIATNHDIFWGGVVSMTMMPNRQKYLANPAHDHPHHGDGNRISGSAAVVLSVAFVVSAYSRCKHLGL